MLFYLRVGSYSMTDLQTEVELVSTDKIIPYSNNPKQHPEEQVDKIASSIKNYGWDQPIVVDGEYEIIKGHGRLQAAKKLGLDRVPIIIRTDLTESQTRAARIADNKTSESQWEIDQLGLEFELINDGPLDLEDTGFSEMEAEGIMDSLDMDIDELFEESEAGGDDISSSMDDAEMIMCPECEHEFEYK